MHDSCLNGILRLIIHRQWLICSFCPIVQFRFRCTDLLLMHTSKIGKIPLHYALYNSIFMTGFHNSVHPRQYQKHTLANIHFMILIDYCLYDHTSRRAVLNVNEHIHFYHTVIFTNAQQLREASLQKYDCQRNYLFALRLGKWKQRGCGTHRQRLFHNIQLQEI